MLHFRSAAFEGAAFEGAAFYGNCNLRSATTKLLGILISYSNIRSSKYLYVCIYLIQEGKLIPLVCPVGCPSAQQSFHLQFCRYPHSS